MTAPAAGGEERADDILGVVNTVPTSRMQSLSAWEDGTPLRQRAQQPPAGWVVDSQGGDEEDPRDLLASVSPKGTDRRSKPQSAPAQERQPATQATRLSTADVAPDSAPRRAALSPRSRARILGALGALGALGVVAAAVHLFGTIALPVAAVAALLVGLLARRGGAR